MKNRVEYVPKKIAVTKNILTVINILFILWIVLSWVEVVRHNQTPNYDYSDLNFFKLLF